jgi:LCP family protein required for cell wall assembly
MSKSNPVSGGKTDSYKRARKVIFPLSRISFLLFLAAAVAFFAVLSGFGIVPRRYLILIALIELAVVLLMAVFTLGKKMSNGAKAAQTVICVILSAMMVWGCVALPTYKGKLAKIFTPIAGEGTRNINVYALTSRGYTSVDDLANKTIGVQAKLDQEAQDYALAQLEHETDNAVFQEYPCQDIYEAVDRLYDGTVDAILLNESYAEIIVANDDYHTFLQDTAVVYQCIQKVTLNYDLSKVGNVTQEPFIIGIIGNDDWLMEDLNDDGGFRSDVNMVLAVNPVTKQILMVSVPRDAYVPIKGNRAMMDKLTHAPVYENNEMSGIGFWIATMNDLLEVDMNYTFKVNFQSMVDIVNALDGIDVDNPYAFTASYVDWIEQTDQAWENYYEFPAGTIHLDGQQALAYCRERYSLPEGDISRNQHQAIVMRALVDKITSVQVLAHIDSLLTSLEGKFMTNMDFNAILALANMQLDDMAVWDLQYYSLSGEPDYLPCYIMGNQELSVIDLDSDSVRTAISYLDRMMAGEKIVVE